jgi:hypothetical protein
MKFRLFGDLNEIGRVSKQFARDAVMSPLRKYIVYSVIFHALLIAALSINMMLPPKPKEAPKTETPKAEAGKAAAPADATKSAKPAAKDAKPAAEPPPAGKTAADKKPAKPGETPKPTAAPNKATGQKDDYYKRQGVDNAPAKQDEIPKNPFDAKDEMKKTLDDLK